MWFILALMACESLDLDEQVRIDPPPTTKVTAEPREEAALPPGEATVRSCFEEEPQSRKMQKSSGSARGSGASRQAKTRPSVRPSPAKPASTSAPKPAPPAQAPAMAAGDPAPGGGMGDVGAVASAPEPTIGAAQGHDGVEVAEMEEWVPSKGPKLDWGAEVYLSNDDSMSLASAQRVLYSLDKDTRISASEVRPHELLNYFTFQTEGVPKGEMFSVAASAERSDDDTLTLAMAVQGATPPRQPLDLTLVIDRSGSMAADGRMEYLKRGLTLLTDSLQRGDRLDVVLFDHGVCTPLEDWVAGRDDPSQVRDVVEGLAPRGSTNLDAGLRAGYELTAGRSSDGRNQRVMLITDALLNTGNVDEDLVSEVAKAYEERGVRLTGVGVGRGFNDEMLDKLTEKGKGAYVYLGSEAVVDRLFGSGFDSLTRTIAHDVRFKIDLPPSLAMERFYGEEASTNIEDVQPIHYYAGTSQVFLQDLALRDSRVVPKDPVTLVVDYRDATTGEQHQATFEWTVGDLLEADPANLAKAQALMAFSDVVVERSMGGKPCGSSFDTFVHTSQRSVDDPEIAYVAGLLGRHCGAPTTGRVAYKVKVDSDQPIAEVALLCGDQGYLQRLGPSDSVAQFHGVLPGRCRLSLVGSAKMHAEVKVPAVGGDTRCMVRSGRMSCS